MCVLHGGPAHAHAGQGGRESAQSAQDTHTHMQMFGTYVCHCAHTRMCTQVKGIVEGQNTFTTCMHTVHAHRRTHMNVRPGQGHRKSAHRAQDVHAFLNAHAAQGHSKSARRAQDVRAGGLPGRG